MQDRAVTLLRARRRSHPFFLATMIAVAVIIPTATAVVGAAFLPRSPRPSIGSQALSRPLPQMNRQTSALPEHFHTSLLNLSRLRCQSICFHSSILRQIDIYTDQVSGTGNSKKIPRHLSIASIRHACKQPHIAYPPVPILQTLPNKTSASRALYCNISVSISNPCSAKRSI